MGQEDSRAGSGSVGCNQRHNEPHRHCSARTTSAARKAFRSTYRTDGQKVAVVLDREAFESPLVNMPFARRVIVSMVTHRVRGRDPTLKTTHFTVPSGTQNQMPVIRHELIGKQLHGNSRDSERDTFRLLHRLVVVVACRNINVNPISNQRCLSSGVSFLLVHVPLPIPHCPSPAAVNPASQSPTARRPALGCSRSTRCDRSRFPVPRG